MSGPSQKSEDGKKWLLKYIEANVELTMRGSSLYKLACLAYNECMTWQLQEVKNKLSEVVETSIRKGPQIISRRGHNTAVIISYKDYQKYIAPKKRLREILASSGLDEIDTTRDKSTAGRSTDFRL
jgi:antitoxin Phd